MDQQCIGALVVGMFAFVLLALVSQVEGEDRTPWPLTIDDQIIPNDAPAKDKD